MAYSADSFTALEVPTLAKMNKLWSNDASFNDGTGIGTGVLNNTKMVDRLRRIPMPLGVDGAGVSNNVSEYGQSVKFPGNTGPGWFARAGCKIPADVAAGSSATVKFTAYSVVATAVGAMQYKYYIGSHVHGDLIGGAGTEWNIASNLTTASITQAAYGFYEITLPTTIPAANITANSYIGVAVQPASTPPAGADMYIGNFTLEYTADM